MKAASFSIIVYILFLLSQPCRDAFAAPSINEENEAIAAVHAPLLAEESSDICSPFCICSCCSLTVGYHSTLYMVDPEHVAIAGRKNDLEYKNPVIENFSASIWQPPKF